jgi:nitrate reductase NapE component
MRQSAVGQKCPSCARLPRSARARGKPVHYFKATAAGLAVAVVGGFLLWNLRMSIGFGAILLPALLGFGVGKAVGWGAQRQSQQPFAGMAIGFAVFGVVLFPLLAGALPWLLSRPFSLLGVAAAGYFALRGLRS